MTGSTCCVICESQTREEKKVKNKLTIHNNQATDRVSTIKLKGRLRAFHFVHDKKKINITLLLWLPKCLLLLLPTIIIILLGKHYTLLLLPFFLRV